MRQKYFRAELVLTPLRGFVSSPLFSGASTQEATKLHRFSFCLQDAVHSGSTGLNAAGTPPLEALLRAWGA